MIRVWSISALSFDDRHSPPPPHPRLEIPAGVDIRLADLDEAVPGIVAIREHAVVSQVARVIVGQRLADVGAGVGGYDRNVISDHEFIEKLRYIHANPVTRGLVAQETDWPWSSARWHAGQDDSFAMDCSPL